MNGLSLFSGIGGLDLGLERAGIRTVGQVEIDPWCRRVLAKHWPDVPRHDDVRTALDWWLYGQVATPNVAYAEQFASGERCGVAGIGGRSRDTEQAGVGRGLGGARIDRPTVDLVFGGFPCQDISNAGRRAGIDGERSGLWSEFHHIVRVLRPRWVLLENVAAILGRGAGRVLGDLAEIGYDAEWDCIPAAAVGAPHLRDRWFAVAYATRSPSGSIGPDLSRAGDRCLSRETGERRAWGPRGGSSPSTEMAYAARDGLGQGGPRRPASGSPYGLAVAPQILAGARGGRRNGRTGILRPGGWGQPPHSGWWGFEPDVGRVVDGVPGRVDRLRGLGNAVVPQVAQHVGELIVRADHALS